MASFNQQPKRLSPLTGTPARMATLYKKYTGAEKRRRTRQTYISPAVQNFLVNI
jgi:hypothetical protein